MLVIAFSLQQFLMLANFTNLASFHNNNFVSTNNRGKRWATTNVVRPCMSSSSDFWMYFSLSVSRALVASSRSKSGAFFKSALAIEMRCFWPPDSLLPASPTGVGIQSLRQSFNKWHQVRCASSFLDLRSRCILVTIGNICRYCVIEDE